jgi:hypothetical protein
LVQDLLDLLRSISRHDQHHIVQTAVFEHPGLEDESVAKFYPFGIESGPADKRTRDPTVFWIPNRTCVVAMLQSVGFQRIEAVSADPAVPFVLCAQVLVRKPGQAPDQTSAPWS